MTKPNVLSCFQWYAVISEFYQKLYLELVAITTCRYKKKGVIEQSMGVTVI